MTGQPSITMEAVQLTYLEVHLYYTIPVTFLLWLISRPFQTTRLWIQVTTLVAIALIYTIPWDNYLVWTGTWSYPEEAVLGRIWYIPLEEYFFFIVQTVMVTLWTFLCCRWSVPYLNFLEARECRAKVIRYTPIPILLTMAALSWSTMITSPNTPSFYLCCIIGWAFPVVVFLWYGAGNYVLKQYKATIPAIMVPTIYLAFVDLVALRRNVWSISPEATSGIFIYDVLPVEEAFFFFIVNIILVLAYCAFEKAFSVLEFYPELFKPDTNIILKLLKAFAISEAALPQQKLKDLQKTLQVLRKASKSFWAAGYIFPPDVRHDLSVLYAFCRVTDDMVDNSASATEKKMKLSLILEFLDALFADRVKFQKNDGWIYELGKDEMTPFKTPVIDWKYYEEKLTPEEIAAFHSLTSISFYLPPEPFYELCRGYEWDLAGRTVVTEADLVEYSKLVASSVAVMCTYILCFKSGRSPNGLEASKHRVLIELARDMGIALQLTNIARDIITDSETLDRCYVPEEYFEKDDEVRATIKDKGIHGLENGIIRGYAMKIIKMAEKYQNHARAGFDGLPVETLHPIICATEIYAGICRVIKRESIYPKRASVGPWEKVAIVLRCLYLPLFVVKRGSLCKF